ncbi:unnamed protein product [Rotaria sordida]|uniref:Uncharacterized protein n=1 Tax=Rotaria sordida TaxID=392033 RepID=A0A818QLM2_9BILA|nr:unnamed protein product [Rotaria sordida]
MSTDMHCRSSYGINTSFLSARPGSITSSNNITYVSSPYHHYDQTSPPPAEARRRRRLEDPITTYASNYYVTFPRQMSQSPSQQASLLPLQYSSLSSSRQQYHQSNHKNIYCDLFNLLERPSSPTPSLIKQRKKYRSNDYSPCRHHCLMDLKNSHTKVKCTNDRKRRHKRYTYNKENKCQDDKLSSIEQYDLPSEKAKKINDIYQRRSSKRGFFRRLVYNYFCLTSTLANKGYSS